VVTDWFNAAQSVDSTQVYAMAQIHGAGKGFTSPDIFVKVSLDVANECWSELLDEENGKR
jgi:hypothetical protein